MSAEDAARLAERARIRAGVRRAEGKLEAALELEAFAQDMREEADNAITAPIVIEMCSSCGNPVRPA